jgi:hypothetical protein
MNVDRHKWYVLSCYMHIYFFLSSAPRTCWKLSYLSFLLFSYFASRKNFRGSCRTVLTLLIKARLEYALEMARSTPSHTRRRRMSPSPSVLKEGTWSRLSKIYRLDKLCSSELEKLHARTVGLRNQLDSFDLCGKIYSFNLCWTKYVAIVVWWGFWCYW